MHTHSARPYMPDRKQDLAYFTILSLQLRMVTIRNGSCPHEPFIFDTLRFVRARNGAKIQKPTRQPGPLTFEKYIAILRHYK